MGGGNTNVQYPQPSQEEKDLQREQLELLRLQRSETEAFKPILLSQFGLEPEYTFGDPTTESIKSYNTKQAQLSSALEAARADPNSFAEGGYGWQALKDWQDFVAAGPEKVKTMTGYKKTAEQTEKERAYNELLKSQQEITSLQLDRQKKALAGELPVSEGTLQRKTSEFQVFKEQMARAGNPIFGDDLEGAFSGTTAGTQALKAFKDNWKLVEDQERRGELTAGASILNQSVGLSSGLRTANLTEPAVPDLGTGRLLPGYLQALSPYQMQRQGQFQASSANAQNAQMREAGVMNLLGTGLGVGAGLFALSSEKYKKGIKGVDSKKVLSSLRKAKIYSFNYKNEPYADDKPAHMGMIAERAPEDLVSPDGEHIDVMSTIGMLTASVQALDKKLAKLKGGKREVARG